jgi:hypothetical protein
MDSVNSMNCWRSINTVVHNGGVIVRVLIPATSIFHIEILSRLWNDVVPVNLHVGIAVGTRLLVEHSATKRKNEKDLAI